MIIKVMDEQMKQASSKYGNIIILYGFIKQIDGVCIFSKNKLFDGFLQ